MSDNIFAIISHGANEMNIELPPNAEAAFKAYYDLLESCGQNVNLTAISGVEEVARLHFLDSLALLNTTKFKKKNVIDIGSGAGFPGLPLKIAEPSINLTLLDATSKRINFLTELSTILKIDASCLNSRAEEAAHYSQLREQYDIAVSRAVARLNILSELCLPFVQVGGKFIAMKSLDSSDELEEAKSAISILGGSLNQEIDYTIPGTNVTHRVIIIDKIQSTPEKYPRRFSRIQKTLLE